MSSEDSTRWNARYEGDDFKLLRTPRTFLVENLSSLPANGLALDVAMGVGGNTNLLRSHGLRVIGVDISDVGVRKAKADNPALDVFIADLNRYKFPFSTFDVIINFYYLNRGLWSDYSRMLKPGGWLVIETLTQEMLKLKPEVDAGYLLQPGELASYFPELTTVLYREGWVSTRKGSTKAIASLIARKTV